MAAGMAKPSTPLAAARGAPHMTQAFVRPWGSMRPDAIKRRTGRVAIVANDANERDALAAMLDKRAEVVALLGADRPFLTELADAAPDVVIWDCGKSLDVAGLRSAVAEGHTVVALVADESRAGELLAAGASAVHLRENAAEHLPLVLAAAAEGLIVLDGAALTRLLGIRRNGLDGLPTEPLTAREREVLTLLAEGRSNHDIALVLGIAERTAKFHVNSILEKFAPWAAPKRSCALPNSASSSCRRTCPSCR